MEELHQCDNCEIVWTPDKIIPLADVKDLGERLTPGCITPSGECPTCGALTYESVVDAEALQRLIVERMQIDTNEVNYNDEEQAEIDITDEGVWCNVRLWHPLEDVANCLVKKENK